MSNHVRHQRCKGDHNTLLHVLSMVVRKFFIPHITYSKNHVCTYLSNVDDFLYARKSLSVMGYKLVFHSIYLQLPCGHVLHQEK